MAPFRFQISLSFRIDLKHKTGFYRVHSMSKRSPEIALLKDGRHQPCRNEGSVALAIRSKAKIIASDPSLMLSLLSGSSKIRQMILNFWGLVEKHVKFS